MNAGPSNSIKCSFLFITCLAIIDGKELSLRCVHEILSAVTCFQVPFYFTDVQRRALLTAIRVSKLNSLRIVNETTAVALAYGKYSFKGNG